MTLHDVSLTDRFDLAKRMVLLGGIQALVRMLLMQKARDEAAGLVTAGYATGYRGSPLAGLDLQLQRWQHFQPSQRYAGRAPGYYWRHS